MLSEAGNNAVILLVPDAPQNLQNVPSITDADQVGLVWAEGDNGGAVVVDWRIWFALENDEYQVLNDAVKQTSYTTTQSLTTDKVYKFKV